MDKKIKMGEAFASEEIGVGQIEDQLLNLEQTHVALWDAVNNLCNQLKPIARESTADKDPVGPLGILVPLAARLRQLDRGYRLMLKVIVSLTESIEL